MAYVALYRAYRPKAFSEVSGQKVIIKTLQNTLLHDKVAHAYLFSGPRGTGKTSIAKIFAKAVNCEHQPNNEPCNECSICKGIDKGDIPDVIEIDAASNNGVDEIRELRDKVKYMPSVGRYKVYIIDEVHMLTPGAFNALLKTLEEPPKHVIFILATTEVHKIPPTILSRCQRFDFKNIETNDIVDKLKHIAEKENIKISHDAIYAVAENAEGGLRDAISLLDQTISYADGEITEDDVHQVSGSVSKKALIKLLTAISNKEISNAMIILKDLLAEGKEISRIVNDLILALRDILLEKSVKVEYVKYKDLVSIFSFDKIYFYLDILNRLQQDMKWTHQKRAYVELALIKMMEHQTLHAIDYEATIMDLKNSMQEIKEQMKIQPKAVVQSSKKPLVSIKQVESILNHSDKEKKKLLQTGWEHLKDYPKNHLKMVAYLLSQAELEAVSDSMLLVYDDINLCKRILEPETKKMVLEIINSKKHLIDDYIAILKTDWLVIKEVYLDLWKKGSKKPKLPPYDLKLYVDLVDEEKKEPEIISLAKDYFGEKAIIKE
ncbi:DNA polymerase III subunit gamma/tau [Peloplasma aerotolerans]|jgi:DNA polymerase III subunit gamma/tau|uniref:DNA polymerase III subunit gamma/tau n=1 Tax=Peloplasma aerotolerans TaxID=3044389 RepID=A0AAW6U929_9MOLU|nr:DNA polymerase III subunit gamma/tau [Mariniplasma sp. M4Ah]MDI6452184.1 DNA polymerase III subunit gamma/tau [Mariniplasma sp. M4Ah]